MAPRSATSWACSCGTRNWFSKDQCRACGLARATRSTLRGKRKADERKEEESTASPFTPQDAASTSVPAAPSPFSQGTQLPAKEPPPNLTEWEKCGAALLRKALDEFFAVDGVPAEVTECLHRAQDDLADSRWGDDHAGRLIALGKRKEAAKASLDAASKDLEAQRKRVDRLTSTLERIETVYNKVADAKAAAEAAAARPPSQEDTARALIIDAVTRARPDVLAMLMKEAPVLGVVVPGAAVPTAGGPPQHAAGQDAAARAAHDAAALEAAARVPAPLDGSDGLPFQPPPGIPAPVTPRVGDQPGDTQASELEALAAAAEQAAKRQRREETGDADMAGAPGEGGSSSQPEDPDIL